MEDRGADRCGVCMRRHALRPRAPHRPPRRRARARRARATSRRSPSRCSAAPRAPRSIRDRRCDRLAAAHGPRRLRRSAEEAARVTVTSPGLSHCRMTDSAFCPSTISGVLGDLLTPLGAQALIACPSANRSRARVLSARLRLLSIAGSQVNDLLCEPVGVTRGFRSVGHAFAGTLHLEQYSDTRAPRWIHISSATPRLAAKASIGVWYRRHFRGVVLRFQTTSSMSASV